MSSSIYLKSRFIWCSKKTRFMNPPLCPLIQISSLFFPPFATTQRYQLLALQQGVNNKATQRQDCGASWLKGAWHNPIRRLIRVMPPRQKREECKRRPFPLAGFPTEAVKCSLLETPTHQRRGQKGRKQSVLWRTWHDKSQPSWIISLVAVYSFSKFGLVFNFLFLFARVVIVQPFVNKWLWFKSPELGVENLRKSVWLLLVLFWQLYIFCFCSHSIRHLFWATIVQLLEQTPHWFGFSVTGVAQFSSSVLLLVLFR